MSGLYGKTATMLVIRYENCRAVLLFCENTSQLLDELNCKCPMTLGDIWFTRPECKAPCGTLCNLLGSIQALPSICITKSVRHERTDKLMPQGYPPMMVICSVIDLQILSYPFRSILSFTCLRKKILQDVPHSHDYAYI